MVFLGVLKYSTCSKQQLLLATMTVSETKNPQKNYDDYMPVLILCVRGRYYGG